MRKVNYLAIVAGIIALTSLFLPWFVMNFTLKATNTIVNFTAYLYQISGSVDVGASQTASINVWFGLTAIAFIVVAAVCAFTGSLMPGKKGKMLIYVTGILSILSIIIFALGLISSDFAGNDGFEYTLTYFQNNLGLTDQQINGGRTGAFNIGMIGYGIWLALVAGIIAFAAIIMHSTDKAPVAKPLEQQPTP